MSTIALMELWNGAVPGHKWTVLLRWISLRQMVIRDHLSRCTTTIPVIQACMRVPCVLSERSLRIMTGDMILYDVFAGRWNKAWIVDKKGYVVPWNICMYVCN